ncbi:undecaprenyl-phosphate glucose phosphotransferase [Halotalea alkalilenta]|nr:undecaprenyl-phosphate glucose phosphotransferase [Halotalea alkalilenta]
MKTTNPIRGLAPVADLAAIFSAGWICYSVLFDEYLLANDYFLFLSGISLLVMCANLWLGGYSKWRNTSLVERTVRLIKVWAIVFVLMSVVLLFSGHQSPEPRTWLLFTMPLSFAFVCALRAALMGLSLYYHSRPRHRKPVLLVGPAGSVMTVARNLRRNAHEGYGIAGVCRLRPGTAFDAQAMAWLARQVSRKQAQEVWICMPFSDSAVIAPIMHALRHSTVQIRLIPEFAPLRLINFQVNRVSGLHAFDLSVTSMTGWASFSKRLEDIVISALILALISPVMIGLAIGVKLTSPGPIFYRQERVGWNGRPFNMLKFRSMPVDAEKAGVQWGNAKGKTTTRFGAFIRRTSLDELPQFINVFLGDMSIVGPRPERTVFVEQFKEEVPNYMKKHMVKAGITGWAQVNGWRGDTRLDKRIECDLWYIENWSLVLDVRIILATAFKVFTDKTAY